MSDPKNPFEAMMKAGQDWAKSLNSSLDSSSAAETFGAAFKGFENMMPNMSAEMLETFMGKTFNPEGLDAKTRLLLTLQGLTIAGATAETQIRLTVKNARKLGASKQEIAETIAMAAMFGGAPAMTKAMELATDAMKEEEDQG